MTDRDSLPRQQVPRHGRTAPHPYLFDEVALTRAELRACRAASAERTIVMPHALSAERAVKAA